MINKQCKTTEQHEGVHFFSRVKFTRVDQITSWRLCLGCGACVAACPENNIKLVDIIDRGLRPEVNSAECQKCGECVRVCPGIGMSHQPFNSGTIPELSRSWGPVLEVWEGYAADSEIRYMGSSGGMATALALYCLEREQVSGVLHISANPRAPLMNMPVFSYNRKDILSCTGSRYSPASPCEKLSDIEKAGSPYVFIGKPCDVVGLRKLQAINPRLSNNVAIAISIFCAGTPATKGTYNLLDVLGVKHEDVDELRYRGCGWPGMMSVKIKGNNDQMHKIGYEQSWNDVLSKHIQYRCRLCPDSTGEFADISCGDPWYREIKPDEQGWSLVLIRTERGKEILQKAIKAGYVKLEQVIPSAVPQSQKALLARRRHLWGRLLVMHVLGIPVPCYTGFYLFRNWLRLPTLEKLRSLAGTFKRIMLRGWKRPLEPVISEKVVQEANGIEDR